MVRWWVTLSFVVATSGATPALAQPTSPDESEAPPVDDAPSSDVPPGAADEALLGLDEDETPETAPEAYPSAAAPPPPAYVPSTGMRPLPPIPPAPLTEDDLPRRSIGMMVTGIVLTSVGAIAALTGAAIAGDAENCEEDASCERVRAHGYGVGLGIGGLAVIGAGIPLLVVGAQRVAPDPAPSVSFSVGPGAFRLRSTF